MKKTAVFLALIAHGLTFSQSVDWGLVPNDTPNQLLMHHTDFYGQSYLFHRYSDSILVDPDTEEYVYGNPGEDNSLLQKIDNDGNFEWAANIIGATSSDEHAQIWDVAADLYGNVYVVGNFKSNIDFDPGIGIEMISGGGTNSTFLLKLDGDGNFQWVKTYVTGFSNYGYEVDLISDDVVVISGIFEQEIDFAPLDDENGLHENDLVEAYVLKLNSETGDYLSSTKFDGDDNIRVSGMEISSDGNIWMTFHYRGSIDADVSDEERLFTFDGHVDMLLIGMDENFGLIEAYSFGGTGFDVYHSLDITPSGDVILLGSSGSIGIDIDPTENEHILTPESIFEPVSDYFFQCFSSNGEFKWAKSFDLQGAYMDFRDIAVGNSEDIYITGSYRDSVDVNPSSGEYILTAEDPLVYNSIILAFDIDGGLVKVTDLSQDVSNAPLNLGVSDNGDVFLSGYFDGAFMNVDPAGIYDELVNADIMGQGNYLVKYEKQFFLSAPELEALTTFSLYPNPTANGLNITFDEATSGELVVYALDGKKVFQTQVNEQNQMQLELDLANGIYQLNIETEHNQMSKKFVVQH